MKENHSPYKVMKKVFSILSTLAVLSTATLAPHVAAKSKASEEQVEPKAVHVALENLEPLSGKLNKKADYYIYLQSASWCGPCVALMPDIVKEYKKFKRKGVELILVSADKTEDDAVDYVKKYKAKFPMVMGGSSSQLPGYAGGGSIPNACIVDADGNLIKKGRGSIILEWKDIVGDHEKELKKAAKEAEKAAKEAEEA